MFGFQLYVKVFVVKRRDDFNILRYTRNFIKNLPTFPCEISYCLNHCTQSTSSIYRKTYQSEGGVDSGHTISGKSTETQKHTHIHTHSEKNKQKSWASVDSILVCMGKSDFPETILSTPLFGRQPCYRSN